MEGLTRFDLQGPVPRAVAALAADLRQTNEREWVVDLRKGIKWTDGKELHPRDFIDSWKRVLTHCRKVPDARLLFPIVGAEDFCRRKLPFSKVGLDIRSPTQFAIRLSHPVPFLSHTLAHPVTWPRRTESTKEAVPTLGAFRVDEQDPLTYHSNPTYYGSAPGMDSIVFLNAPSVEERIGLYREHSADVVEDLDDTTAVRLGTDPDLFWVGTGPRIYLLLDSTRPIQAAGARRALAAAIDREEIPKLLRLPLLPIRSLNRELVEESALPANPSLKSFLEKSEARLTLTWEKHSHLENLASALRAQWAKTGGLAVDVHTGSNGQLHLVVWNESWFEPELPPFIANRTLPWEKVQKQWLENDPRVCPLFERAKALLKSPGLRAVQPYPVGGWNFAALQWG
jgi:ABC-type oligopeptide transport system substrate-binding subunit